VEGVSLGAVGAALIAAIASVIVLILGKEAKTSEFRQEWIDSLRAEISEYLSSLNTISTHLLRSFKDANEKITDLAPFYTKVNSAAFMIRLRLNSREVESKSVLDLMDKYERLSKDDKTFTSSAVDQLENEMLAASQVLLKAEWKRVKDGEITFRIAKWASIALTVGLIVLVLAAAALDLIRGRASRSGTPAPGAVVQLQINAAQVPSSAQHAKIIPMINPQVTLRVTTQP